MMKTEVNLNNPELKIYYELKENQLYRINEPEPGIFIAESPYVVERALEAGYEPLSFLVEREQLNENTERLLEGQNVPVYVASYEELKTITGYHMSRGLLCAMKRKPNPDVKELLRDKKRIVVLENIMNPTNTGAIIRSAVALGCDGMLLTKGCADPLQRRSSRVSMGNVFSLPWAYLKSLNADTELLGSLGFTTVSMALDERAISLGSCDFSKLDKLAVIMGTEGEGLSPETIENSDFVVKIPMANGVDSLNVAAASAVAFWELYKYR